MYFYLCLITVSQPCIFYGAVYTLTKEINGLWWFLWNELILLWSFAVLNDGVTALLDLLPVSGLPCCLHLVGFVCLEVANCKSVNWPLIFNTCNSAWSAWMSALHCCQESEPWHYDPHMVVLRLSLNTKGGRGFAMRALSLWNNPLKQISWAKSVTSFCVPAESLLFQTIFYLILWFYITVWSFHSVLVFIFILSPFI